MVALRVSCWALFRYRGRCNSYVCGGFTLFEVLVALAIMAVALTALLRASGLAAENSMALRQRMLAGWVAENYLVKLKARGEWPSLGKTSGELEEEGQRWRWELEVVETPNPDFRKIKVRILAPGAQYYVLSELVGFLMRPPGSAVGI